MSYEVGKVYEVTKKSGKTVQRKCVAIIDGKYMEEQKELTKKNGFAPIFVKEGAVFLAMSPTGLKRLTEEEKEKRAKDKAKAKEANRKKRLAAKEAKIAKLQAEKAELES